MKFIVESVFDLSTSTTARTCILYLYGTVATICGGVEGTPVGQHYLPKAARPVPGYPWHFLLMLRL